MDIKIIALAMTSILAGLFIFAKFFAPKEKQKMLLEGSYVNAIHDLKKSPEDSNLRNSAETAAKGYATALGLNDDEAIEMLNKDLA